MKLILLLFMLSGCITHKDYIIELTTRCTNIDITDKRTKLKCPNGGAHVGLRSTTKTQK